MRGSTAEMWSLDLLGTGVFSVPHKGQVDMHWAERIPSQRGKSKLAPLFPQSVSAVILQIPLCTPDVIQLSCCCQEEEADCSSASLNGNYL